MNHPSDRQPGEPLLLAVTDHDSRTKVVTIDEHIARQIVALARSGFPQSPLPVTGSWPLTPPHIAADKPEPCQHKNQKWKLGMNSGHCGDCGALLNSDGTAVGDESQPHPYERDSEDTGDCAECGRGIADPIHAAQPAGDDAIPLEESLGEMVKAIGGKVTHMNGPDHPQPPWEDQPAGDDAVDETQAIIDRLHRGGMFRDDPARLANIIAALRAKVAELEQSLANMTYFNNAYREQAETWRGAACESGQLKADLAALRAKLTWLQERHDKHAANANLAEADVERFKADLAAACEETRIERGINFGLKTDLAAERERAEKVAIMCNQNASKVAALKAIAKSAKDVIESRYHPQYDMNEKLNTLECSVIDLRVAGVEVAE